MMKRSTHKSTILILSVLLLAAASPISEAGYVTEISPNDSAATAQNLVSYFTYGTNTVIEMDAAGTLSYWSASVYGFSGDSTYDYYAFSVGTGDSPLKLNMPVAFDIDFAYVDGLDTILTLYDTDGTTILKYNDDNPVDGPGDIKANTLNSFLSYTFTTPGTYYIRVSEFDPVSAYGYVLTSDGSYHLHVSTVPVPSSLLLMVPGLLGCIGIKRRFPQIFSSLCRLP